MLCVKELSWLEILALLERRESLGGLREAEQKTQARTQALSAGAPAIANATTNMHADKRSRQHAHTRTLTHQTAYASTSIHRHSQTKHPQGIFEEVYAPLVDQIENDLGGSDAYEARVDEFVVPSIAQLAMAVHDDAMWKKLNHSVLLKTRHHETQVRLLESLVARLFASAFFPFNGIAQPQCPAQGKARQDTRE